MLLAYKDVTLISRVVSEIDSRDDIDISLNYAGRKLSVPLIAAPMPDVCDGVMARELISLGAFGYIHRFNTIEEQLLEFYKTEPKARAGCAIGITGDYLERFKTLLYAGCDAFVIDVANGANKKVRKVVEQLRSIDNDIHICCGNVCSKETCQWLNDTLGISSIRCGIAGGSVCTTRTETGIFNPMFSTMIECSEIEHKQACLIADGSIKEPQDLCKALVYGDIAMAGGIFAGCKEAPGEVLKFDNKMYKVFRGAASFSTQRKLKDTVKYVEGNETLVPYTGSVSAVIQRFKNGLVSSMSYMNARTLEEYKKNVSWGVIR